MKKVIIGLVIVFGVMQFFRIDKTNPPVEMAQDFIEITKPPSEVVEILKASCYDCHSNESKYPWYSNVAPVSWWVKDHIDEGRDELNFSEWGTFTDKRKSKKIKEVLEEVEEEEMPLPPYLITHTDATLSPEQTQKLMDWFRYLQMKNG